MSRYAEHQPDGTILLRVKAVPGASRDSIAGVLGDRLKIRVAAPPEGGKANTAIQRLLADTLGVPARSVVLISGPASTMKLWRIECALTTEELASALEK